MTKFVLALATTVLLVPAVPQARPKATHAQCVATCGDAVSETCGAIPKRRKFNRCRTKVINQCRRFGTAKMCPPPTTTTTPTTVTTTTTLGSTSSCSAQWCDRGATVYDTATGLEWEKKTTQIGSGVNPADLHDVDNTYVWSGRCHNNSVKYCQPNQAAEDTCDAYTDLPDRVHGCQQCVGDEGPCDIGIAQAVYPNGITTVWDWLNQLNVSSYAGHNDWRLPSEAGCNDTACSHADSYLFNGTCTACQVHELESIVYPHYSKDSTDRTKCLRAPCIDSIFDVTQSRIYWSATSDFLAGPGGLAAWDVDFGNGGMTVQQKLYSYYVRAVRNGAS